MFYEMDPSRELRKRRKSIRSNYKTLVDQMHSCDVRIKLFLNEAITPKENEEIKYTNGPLAQNEKLLEIILNKNEPDCLVKFVEALNNSDTEGNQFLSGILNEAFNCKPSDSDIKELRGRLQANYKLMEWRILRQVPYESFKMDVGNESQILLHRCEAQQLNETQYYREMQQTENPSPEYRPIKITRIEDSLAMSENPLCMTGKPFHKERRDRSISFPNIKLQNIYYNKTRNLSIGTDLQRSTIQDVSPKANNNLNEIKFTISPSPTSELEKVDRTRLIICSGDAGMGKSTFTKRIAYQWSNTKPRQIAHYELVFAIVLNSVNHHKSIIEILKENKYLLESHVDIFEDYLENGYTAKNVLFLLDGCDEIKLDKNSEVWKLISGELYPGVNVFVTTRPETDIFDDLCNLHPAMKVKMTGIDFASIEKYISEFLKGQDDDIKYILKQCEKHQFDFNILSTPLYITMFCLMFHNKFGKDAHFTKKKIPESNTELLNGFMEVIIRRGMKRYYEGRIGKTIDVDHIKFAKSPLDAASTIPLHIKHNIYFVAKMSFESLLKKQHTFCDEDLKEYKLNKKILTNMGLFCPLENSDVFFFQHKLIQEYLAALYIADEGFKLKSLSDMIDLAAKQNLKPNLSKIFSSIQYPVQMACGLSMDFYLKLLALTTNIASVTREDFNMCNMQVQYEFSLCYEAGCYRSGSERATKALENYLLNVPVVRMPWAGMTICSPYHKRCISSVTSCFSKETAQKLLLRWYDLDTDIGIHTQDSEDDGETSARLLQVSGMINSKEVQNIDIYKTFQLENGIGIVCLALLSQFSFPDVTSLCIKGESGVLDISQLLVIFPRIKTLDMEVKFCSENIQDSDLKNKIDDGNFSRSLKRFKQRGSTHMKFPVPSIECLFRQSHLEQLELHGSDILSNIRNISKFPQWSNLQSLQMKWCNIDEDNTNDLVQILQHTPDLKKLDLAENGSINITLLTENVLAKLENLKELNLAGVGLNLDTTISLCLALSSLKKLKYLNLSDNYKLDLQSLFRCIGNSFSNLQELRLVRSIEKESSAILVTHLPNMYSLEVIGLFSLDIQDVKEELAEALIERSQKISHTMFTIEIEESELEYDRTFQGELQARLKKNKIHVNELCPQ